MKNPTKAGAAPAQISVTVKAGPKKTIITAVAGTRLIDALQGLTDISFFTACGGRGICKKCLVDIAGRGMTLACACVLDHDIEVTVPSPAAARILEYGCAGARRVACDGGIEALQEEGGVTVRHDGAVIAKGEKSAVYGAAVDIGTTTVVVYVDDLRAGVGVAVESFVNPQAAMGGDVISRIHFVMEHETGLARLQRSIVTAINKAVEKACSAAGVSGPGEIRKLTAVGNPTMLHLLLGVDPSSIAVAPYAPAFTEAKTLRASALGLAINPGAAATALPSIAGYVGADIVAGIASTPMTNEKEYSLYLDIGTNGEMALGNRDGLVCCSSAAGPAFEGAGIRCGSGGVEGAICSYENGAYGTIGGRPPTGICGSGVLDIIAWYLDKGIIDESGFMESDAVIERRGNAGCGSDIVVTPADVRQVQLAKAAVAAGIKILMKEAGVGPDAIGRVFLAGAFGNYMNVSSAARIGMLPPELASRVVCIGNAAGTGARLALRSREFERSLGKIIAMAEYVELSGRPDFNDMFVAEMGLARPG